METTFTNMNTSPEQEDAPTKWEYLFLEARKVSPSRGMDAYRNLARGIAIPAAEVRDALSIEPFPWHPYYETVWFKNGAEENSFNSLPPWRVLHFLGAEGWELVVAFDTVWNNEVKCLWGGMSFDGGFKEVLEVEGGWTFKRLIR